MVNGGGDYWEPVLKAARPKVDKPGLAAPRCNQRRHHKQPGTHERNYPRGFGKDHVMANQDCHLHSLDFDELKSGAWSRLLSLLAVEMDFVLSGDHISGWRDCAAGNPRTLSSLLIIGSQVPVRAQLPR